jgi:hypothetical protein
MECNVTQSTDPDTVILTGPVRFRWVFCQLEDIRRCRKRNDVTKTLESLPDGLPETYDRILRNIDEKDRDDALKILRFLAFSSRPVTIEEVAEVVAVDLVNLLFDPGERLIHPRETLSICSSLVSFSARGDNDREHTGE